MTKSPLPTASLARLPIGKALQGMGTNCGLARSTGHRRETDGNLNAGDARLDRRTAK